MNTTTIKNITTAAMRWLEVNWRYLNALPANAPVVRAAANEYRQRFNRDMMRDIHALKTWRPK